MRGQHKRCSSSQQPGSSPAALRLRGPAGDPPCSQSPSVGTATATTTTARFWSKVDRSGGEEECWEWQACGNGRGYGKFRFKGRMALAHRVSAELAGMEIKGLCVCHHCDNPLCVNPKHLFVGSHGDNMADKSRKGRASKGVRHGRARLDVSKVREARRMASEGVSVRRIAKLFGVNHSTIHLAVTRKTWKEVK